MHEIPRIYYRVLLFLIYLKFPEVMRQLADAFFFRCIGRLLLLLFWFVCMLYVQLSEQLSSNNSTVQHCCLLFSFIKVMEEPLFFLYHLIFFDTLFVFIGKMMDFFSALRAIRLTFCTHTSTLYYYGGWSHPFFLPNRVLLPVA